MPARAFPGLAPDARVHSVEARAKRRARKPLEKSQSLDDGRCFPTDGGDVFAPEGGRYLGAAKTRGCR